MSDYSGMPSEISNNPDVSQGVDRQIQDDAIQAAARHGSDISKTLPSAQSQSYMSQMSNQDINSANSQARVQHNTDKNNANKPNTGKIQSLLSPAVTAPAAPIVAQQPVQSAPVAAAPVQPVSNIAQNKSLNMNMSPNATGDMVLLPNGTHLETSSVAPASGIGPDIKDSKGNSVGYGPKTQADFAQMFNVDPGVITKAWASGAESKASYSPQDYTNIKSALDSMNFKYANDADALKQWQTIRNAAAQTSLASYNDTKNNEGGPVWGIPIQQLSDGTMGRKLYSVPTGIMGGNMPPKSDQPIQKSSPGVSSDTGTPTAKTNFDLSFLKNIPLSSIGNLIGDAVGQGSRGDLAYAGDFNFRTPQELRQMAQTQRESDILKNKGMLGNEYNYEAEMNAPGGPNEQALLNQQKDINQPRLTNEQILANIGIKPGMAAAANQLPVAAINSTNGLGGMQYMNTGSPRVGSITADDLKDLPPKERKALMELLKKKNGLDVNQVRSDQNAKNIMQGNYQ
jgi:hypothetical protein